MFPSARACFCTVCRYFCKSSSPGRNSLNILCRNDCGVPGLLLFQEPLVPEPGLGTSFESPLPGFIGSICRLGVTGSSVCPAAARAGVPPRTAGSGSSAVLVCGTDVASSGGARCGATGVPLGTLTSAAAAATSAVSAAEAITGKCSPSASL